MIAVFAVSSAVMALAADRELPDPTLTPGAVASVDQAEVCGVVDGLSYSERHRATTKAMKTWVRRQYGAAHCGEIDHPVPLALGGADIVLNLWCQPGPEETAWHYKLKDDLETFVWSAVCVKHTMSLAEGQAIFLKPDWRIEYCRLIGGAICPP